jgi:hypothetical protein
VVGITEVVVVVGSCTDVVVVGCTLVVGIDVLVVGIEVLVVGIDVLVVVGITEVVVVDVVISIVVVELLVVVGIEVVVDVIGVGVHACSHSIPEHPPHPGSGSHTSPFPSLSASN